MRLRLLVVFALAAGTIAPPAYAGTDGDEDDASPPAPTTSYAWQTLSLDAVALATALAVNHTATDQHSVLVDVGGPPGAFIYTQLPDGPDAPAAWIPLGLYALGPPLVHLAHGRPAAAAGSFALRLGLPLLAVVGGEAVAGASCALHRDDGGFNFCWLTGALLGYLGVVSGYGVAVVADALLLAREPAADAPPPASSSIHVFPTASVARGGFVLGLGGTL